MNCQYCNKEYYSIHSLRSHERLCKMNPNKVDSPFIVYNKSEDKKLKGESNQYTKAKRLNLPQPQLSDLAKEHIGNIWRGKHLPKEVKNKISKSYKLYLENNPNKVPFLVNHSSKQSYLEQYFEEIFNNENIPLQYHKQIGRYELDFYNENLMKYVEIDGDQHYSDYMIKHDKERDEYLQQLGWKGLRIKWSEYKKLNFEDKQKKIQEIKNFLIF